VIPQVVVDLADVLPQLKGADLESQLQTFDALLEHLPLLARQAFATISS
jgi:hypothetical protein